MARLTVVLPVVADVVGERHARQGGDPVVHRLAVGRAVDVAERLEQVVRKHVVTGFRLLKTQDVGNLLVQEPLYDLAAKPDRVYVPRRDLEGFRHGRCLNEPPSQTL
jgi:hypothetical protein